MKKNKKSLLTLRDAAILKRFDALVNKKEDGVTVYSIEYIYKKLSEEFYLEQKTLNAIIKGYYHAKYAVKPSPQLNLFDEDKK